MYVFIRQVQILVYDTWQGCQSTATRQPDMIRALVLIVWDSRKTALSGKVSEGQSEQKVCHDMYDPHCVMSI